MGGETVAAVAPARAAVLEDLAAAQVQIGDLEDLEIAGRAGAAQVVIGSSHAVPSARRLGLPLLRAGFPQYDLVGGYQKTWVGYRGTRQTLFDLANLLLEHHGQHEIRPFRSRYATKGDADPAAAPAAAGGRQH
jgi:nitrogenase molybdenum-iron protein NifN